MLTKVMCQVVGAGGAAGVANLALGQTAWGRARSSRSLLQVAAHTAAAAAAAADACQCVAPFRFILPLPPPL
jgi:hypothetical protein